MEEQIKEQIRFVLEDDKGVDRNLTKKYEQILAKVDRGKPLSQEDLHLTRNANTIQM